jgi:preprotein translocase subunit SecA
MVGGGATILKEKVVVPSGVTYLIVLSSPADIDGNGITAGTSTAALVSENKALLYDARTPLIISGPVPDGDRHEFNELKPKIDNLYNLQRQLANGFIAEAKRLIKEGNTKDGGFQLLRAYRALPKNKALIKFLSEEGVKQILQKTEN